MATIDMSPAFGPGYVTRMLGYTLAANSSVGYPAGAPMLAPGDGGTANQKTYLSVMKGTIPIDFSTLVNSTSRSADKLITFSTGTDFSPSATTVNPAIISTNYVAAGAPGIATWFWIYTVYNGYTGSLNGLTSPAGVSDTTLLHQLIGTAGAVGSGADLEIPDTNIVAGNAYRILNLRLQFPTTWTFA